MEDYILDYIDQNDFENHVALTIKEYNETLKGMDLKRFNKNLIREFLKGYVKSEVDYFVTMNWGRCL